MTSTKPKTSYYYKLFRVKRSDGRVTTVSVDPVLAMRAAQAMGDVKVVGKVVREAALAYQDGMGKNCSNFVSAQLRDAVDKALVARRTSGASKPAEALSA